VCSGTEADQHVAAFPVGATWDSWSSENLQLRRRLLDSHVSPPCVLHQIQLPKALRGLQNLRDDSVRRGRKSWAQARRSVPQRGFHGVLQLLRRLEEPVPDADEVGGIGRREASRGSQERDKARGEGGGWGQCGGVGEDESVEIGGLRDDENRASGTLSVRESERGLGGAEPRCVV